MTDPADPAPQPPAFSDPLPPDPPARRPMSPGFFLWIGLAVICLIAAVVVGLFGSRIWPKNPPKPVAAVSAPADPTAAALRTRVAQLEQELAEARRLAEVAPTADGLDEPAARALAVRIARLEASQRHANRAAAAAIAAAALADAAQTSRPFSGELAVLERLTPDSALVAGLKPLANVGAPTRAALAAEFPDTAARAAAAARAPGKNASFLSRAFAALGSLVTIRRVDRLTGDSPDAVLARAERRATDGDIEGALDQLTRLPPAAQAATADWRERARRRIDIERRIAALRAGALRDLSFGDGNSGLPDPSLPDPSLPEARLPGVRP